MGRPLAPLASLVVVAAAAAVSAPATAVGRAVIDRPAADGWIRVHEQPARPGHLIAGVRPGRVVSLRSRPFGPIVSRVGASTEFGSPRTLGVKRTTRGRWLAVSVAGVRGNRTVWVDARAGGLAYARTLLEVDIDLSARMLTVRRGDAVVRNIRVGVGRPGSSTPTGRFAVTDKLSGPAFSAAYGCCILPLSATQPNLPNGWTGGNRIAIHGTLSAGDFGRAVSAGCVHAREADLRYLMRILPLGTPVVIRP